MIIDISNNTPKWETTHNIMLGTKYRKAITNENKYERR